MDTRGARHLKARLAIGAAVGERVEVVAVEAGSDTPLTAGETGELVSIGEGVVRLRLDRGTEHDVDPTQVRLRRVA
jgi:putative component of toxin-antitoxin plasmid stabilization module